MSGVHTGQGSVLWCTCLQLAPFGQYSWGHGERGGVSALCAHRVKYLNIFSTRWSPIREVVDGTWWALRHYHSPHWIRMIAVISWWALDGHYHFLMGCG